MTNRPDAHVACGTGVLSSHRSPQRSSEGTRARDGWKRWQTIAIGGSLAVGVLLAVLRVKPQVWGDEGVWLSMAARLLDGDRLYADVFDNKDPFFFYSYAAGLWVAGVRGPFALEVVWLAVATVGMALALRSLGVGVGAMLAGALVYPFALTAAWYTPGATMVPALALAPMALWLWSRGSTFAAGVVVVVSALFKLNLGLVVAAPLIALLVLGTDEQSRRRRALHAAGGTLAALAAASLVLAARGELRPYLDLIDYNIQYSDAAVHGGGVRAHLDVVHEFFAASGKWQLPAAELAVVLLLVVTVFGWVRLGRTFKKVSTAAVATLGAAFVTLALTAIFAVHLQMLAYPLALGAATLVMGMEGIARPLGAVAAAVCVAFALWSSLKLEDLSKLTLHTWTTKPPSTPGLTLESARQQVFPGAGRVTYAVFGRNTEDGHAAYIDSGMDMRCRYFHQYPFYRQGQLEETMGCVRRERPMLVLVTTSFYDPMPGEPQWESFVSGARALLSSRYELVKEVGMSQVWKRR